MFRIIRTIRLYALQLRVAYLQHLSNRIPVTHPYAATVKCELIYARDRLNTRWGRERRG